MMDYENLGSAMAQGGLDDRIKLLGARIVELERVIAHQAGVIETLLSTMENYSVNLERMVVEILEGGS